MYIADNFRTKLVYSVGIKYLGPTEYKMSGSTNSSYNMLLHIYGQGQSKRVTWEPAQQKPVLIHTQVLKDLLMQPSMGTLNSPSSRVVKDSTPSRRQILRCVDFGIGESSPISFLNMMSLYLVKFETW